MLPLSAPETVMEIEYMVPPAILNWGHNTAAPFSSVGPETVPQLTTSVAAEAVLLNAAAATRATNERVREFMIIWVGKTSTGLLRECATVLADGLESVPRGSVRPPRFGQQGDQAQVCRADMDSDHGTLA